jgi:hypothetical protein
MQWPLFEELRKTHAAVVAQMELARHIYKDEHARNEALDVYEERRGELAVTISKMEAFVTLRDKHYWLRWHDTKLREGFEAEPDMTLGLMTQYDRSISDATISPGMCTIC